MEGCYNWMTWQVVAAYDDDIPSRLATEAVYNIWLVSYYEKTRIKCYFDQLRISRTVYTGEADQDGEADHLNYVHRRVKYDV